MSKLIKIESEKTPEEVISQIRKKAGDYDFIIREAFNMGDEFRAHGVRVDKNFEYYSVMFCSPERAYESIIKSPLRGALLLPPKQVVVFKEKGKTFISYVAVEEEDVKKLLPEDEKFQNGLSESCEKIIELIRSID